jgi:hypothetical protein
MTAPESQNTATTEQIALVATWQKRIQYMKIAHYQSCNKFERRNKVLGTVVIFLAAAVGPATYVFDKLKLDSPATFLALVLLGLSAGVLATLQIFFRDSERAEKHHSAGATYAKLEMDIETLAAFPPNDGKLLEARIGSFRDEWQRLTGQGPVIPARIYRMHSKEIEGLHSAGAVEPFR